MTPGCLTHRPLWRGFGAFAAGSVLLHTAALAAFLALGPPAPRPPALPLIELVAVPVAAPVAVPIVAPVPAAAAESAPLPAVPESLPPEPLPPEPLPPEPLPPEPVPPAEPAPEPPPVLATSAVTAEPPVPVPPRKPVPAAAPPPPHPRPPHPRPSRPRPVDTAVPAPAPVPAIAAPAVERPPPPSQPAPTRAASYVAQVQARLLRAKRYPPRARREGREGTAVVRFTVDRDGDLQGWKIVRGSGEPLLDEEVAAMLQRAAPFPPFPDGMAAGRLELEVAVEFQLKQG